MLALFHALDVVEFGRPGMELDDVVTTLAGDGPACLNVDGDNDSVGMTVSQEYWRWDLQL
ncbi:MAG: hypothetical protein JWM02_2768 [Frankiales bacterium]|nr:hypothetical protein [Frankiales bacterium]